MLLSQIKSYTKQTSNSRHDSECVNQASKLTIQNKDWVSEDSGIYNGSLRPGNIQWRNVTMLGGGPIYADLAIPIPKISK